MLAAFMIPVLAWPAFVIVKTGSYYSQEVAIMREFVWMIDSLERGGVQYLAGDAFRRLGAYGETFLAVTVFPLLLLVALAVAQRLLRRDPPIPAGPSLFTRNAIIYFLIADVCFFALVGTYETRLSWSAVPPLIVLVGLETQRLAAGLSPRQALALRVVALSVAFAHAGFWILRAGPYS